MDRAGPLNVRPAACALTPSTGEEQVARWRAFNDDYLLDVERTRTTLTVHYDRVADSVRRLRDLVDVEIVCCPFVDWAVEDTQDGLRLVVSGTPAGLAALDVGNG